MYCIYGESRSSLLIESANSMIYMHIHIYQLDLHVINLKLMNTTMYIYVYSDRYSEFYMHYILLSVCDVDCNSACSCSAIFWVVTFSESHLFICESSFCFIFCVLKVHTLKQEICVALKIMQCLAIFSNQKKSCHLIHAILKISALGKYARKMQELHMQSSKSYIVCRRARMYL